MELIQALAGTGHVSLTEATRLVGPDTPLAEAFDELRVLGFPLSIGPDGVRWIPGASALSPAAVERVLSDAGQYCRVECTALTDSTNARLLARAAGGEREPCALLAECQSAGRGRRQRRWQARYGEAILFSVLLEVGRPASELPGLAIATGVALASALEEFGLAGVTLKWPNDVLLDGRKLAGILVEATGGQSSEGMAVVGVGLNWRLSETARARIDQPVADLTGASSPVPGDRSHVAGRLIAAVLAMAQRFRRGGLAPFLVDYARFDALSSRPVEIRTESGVQSGIARGLAADGALRVAHEGVERTYRSADISVRAA